jgi:phenylacetic acid degradation operon negative regulatory protein
MILDDVDARPGSATSLLRTIVGVGLRRLGGRVRVADLIVLMQAVGLAPAATRTAVLRVKRKGLLLPDTVSGQPGYRLNPEAVPMLERGDRRIFTFRQQGDRDPWCLISYSIPETQRDARYQLRRRLAGIGCGTVATGLWICPAFLADEAEGILTELGLRQAATLFITATPQTPGTLAEAARQWWDLDRLAKLHRAFLVNRGSDATQPVTPRDAFARFITALDEWRILPYVDPGLPPSALPVDWPGFDSVALFERITATLAEPARQFVDSVGAVSVDAGR